MEINQSKYLLHWPCHKMVQSNRYKQKRAINKKVDSWMEILLILDLASQDVDNNDKDLDY